MSIKGHVGILAVEPKRVLLGKRPVNLQRTTYAQTLMKACEIGELRIKPVDFISVHSLRLLNWL